MSGGIVDTEAAVLWETGSSWSVEAIGIDPPLAGEVAVRIAACGLCHSDEHVLTGDLPLPLPIVGGHEGAGTVEEVGPGVTSVKPGDHVVFGFLPVCGRCPSCSTGHQNLCDLGMHLAGGLQISDGTSRHHAQGKDLNLVCLVGAFARHTVVNEASCIKIEDHFPFDKACLVGCAVTTGWGAAVYAAGVRPGDNVAVVGIGGVGINAVQGARMAGASRIFAIDPVAFKREQAVRFGATHVAASMEEATELIGRETWGRMCAKVIVAMGVGRGEDLAAALAITAKLGRVVIVNISPWTETQVAMSMLDLTLMEKQVVGCLFGSANPRADIPKLLELSAMGRLDLDGLVTRTYQLADVNQGYQDMREGVNIRGVLVLD